MSNTKATPAVRERCNYLQEQFSLKKNTILSVLPKHLKTNDQFDKMKQSIVLAVQKNPKLAEACPISFIKAAVFMAELGLNADALGEAYFVPFWNSKLGKNEVQMIVGYQGLMRIAYNSGDVTSFDSGVVREGDEFDYEKGTKSFLRHKVGDDTANNKITHAWAMARFKNGDVRFEVLSYAECMRLRSKSKSGQDAKGNPIGVWKDHEAEMCEKSVIRRLCKKVPRSTSDNRLHYAVTAEERYEIGLNPADHYDALETEAEVIEKPKGTGDKVMEELGIAEPKDDKDELPFE